MEIECQGCYYTLCAFVCLTEDLSEILQFLWKHGCLRRSYYCEKCGRKCAIGDKDLFFRCNRNTINIPATQILPVQSNDQEIVDSLQTSSQIQTNGNRQSLPNQINQINHYHFMIHDPHVTDLNQSNRAIKSSNEENVESVNQVDRLQPPELLHSDEKNQNDSVNVSTLSDSVLNNSEVNQNSRILTIIDSQGNHISYFNNQNSFIKQEHQSSSILPLIQIQPIIKYLPESKLNESESESEPAEKVLKKLDESETKKPAKKRCNFKVSMKKGTFFEKSKLPIDTVCKFVVFWCCMKHPTQEFLRNELSLATRTVVDWSTACREICIHWAKSVSEKIGGDGVIVQVDEVKVQDSKECKQNGDGNRFSFWGMEKDKEKGKIFIVSVPVCDSWNLLTVINDWVLPGSIIISNCWKAYDCLKLQGFIQQTVVQSKTFVHPQNSAGSQNFEGKTEEAEDFHMPRFGTRRSHHLGDLAEFMFKRRYSNHLERMHVFFKQISLAYPLY